MEIETQKRLSPQNYSQNLDRFGFNRALKIFHEASKRVPAYKDFLKENKVKSQLIKTRSDFEQVPPVDKLNYFLKYTPEQMSWDGNLYSAKYISSSSGSTGKPLYWPRGSAQDVTTAAIFKQIYEKIFQTKRYHTLFINSFALGTWIAGLENYNATKRAIEDGNKIVTTTPGIEREIAVGEVMRLAKHFDQVILAGYPPFVKDIIELGLDMGIDWSSWNINLMTAGEAISEMWRDYVLNLIGKDGHFSSLINYFGMAETGIIGHETPLSIALRRLLNEKSSTHLMGLPNFSQVLGLYQYYPTTRFYETTENNSLYLTANSGLPLIRYNTHDSGGIIDFKKMTDIVEKEIEADADKISLQKSIWQLPFIYLYGRKDLSVSLYGVNIYTENVKKALESLRYFSKFTGLFIISVDFNKYQNPKLQITFELARKVKVSTLFKERMKKDITGKLQGFNSEYSKLSSSIGKKAEPKITLVNYGTIDTSPGKKHKWIRKSRKK